MSRIKIFYGLIIAIVVSVIGLGLYYAGSPAQARREAIDRAKVSDLQQITWAAQDFAFNRHTLPESLDQLQMTSSGYNLRIADPETAERYTYEMNPDAQLYDQQGFRLCATFLTDSEDTTPELRLVPKAAVNEDWTHPAGSYCFDRYADVTASPNEPIRVPKFE